MHWISLSMLYIWKRCFLFLHCEHSCSLLHLYLICKLILGPDINEYLLNAPAEPMLSHSQSVTISPQMRQFFHTAPIGSPVHKASVPFYSTGKLKCYIVSSIQTNIIWGDDLIYQLHSFSSGLWHVATGNYLLSEWYSNYSAGNAWFFF